MDLSRIRLTLVNKSHLRLAFWSLLACVAVSCGPVNAQGVFRGAFGGPSPRYGHQQARPFLDIVGNSPADAILRQAASAGRTIRIYGQQTTVLYGARTLTSTQTIYRNGREDYRCEFHSPPRMNGVIIVSRPDISWRYNPEKRELKIGKGKQHPGQMSVGRLVKALKAGQATASLLGTDAVAGRAANVVEIASTGAGPGGSAKLWIDQASGALLRTDLFGPNYQPISSTFYTSINLNPQFPPNAFDEPQVPADTTVTQAQQAPVLPNVPSDAEAGFHVLVPSYVPGGYVFQSAKVFQAMGKNAVSFTYQSNLSTLSVYEAPLDGPDRTGGVPHSPRAGTVMLNDNGMRTVAIGVLDTDQLVQVLRSLH